MKWLSYLKFAPRVRTFSPAYHTLFLLHHDVSRKLTVANENLQQIRAIHTWSVRDHVTVLVYEREIDNLNFTLRHLDLLKETFPHWDEYLKTQKVSSHYRAIRTINRL